MLLEYSNINFKNSESNCIIVVGSPGSGKSTFCKNYLNNIFNNVKKQDFDRYVEYQMKHHKLDPKNPNDVNMVHKKPNINKTYKTLRNSFFDDIKSTDNVLFDISGRHVSYISEVVDLCSLSGIKNFTLVWVLVDYPMAVSRNIQRDRTVDYKFLEESYFNVKTHIPNYYDFFDDFQVVVNTEPNLEGNILQAKSNKINHAELNLKNKSFYDKQGYPTNEISNNPMPYINSVYDILNYTYFKNDNIFEVLLFNDYIKKFN